MPRMGGYHDPDSDTPLSEVGRRGRDPDQDSSSSSQVQPVYSFFSVDLSTENSGKSREMIEIQDRRRGAKKNNRF